MSRIKLSKIISIILLSIMLFLINTGFINASSATISVSSSSNKVVVGNTFTVTIRAKSSTYFGIWEFSPSYNKSVFKLVSGNSSEIFYGKSKDKSYTYKFKAISSGSGTFSVKSASIRDYDNEKEMSLSKGSTTVNVITESQLEESYSKNNNLRSLSIDGLKLSPSFNKNTLKYTAEASANTTKIKIYAYLDDSRSRVSGAGTKSVVEGENKFNITVTAQNGSTKTYTIIVKVTDPNPIEVTIGEEKYTIVKRESNLKKVDGFKASTVKINDQKIPCLFNETNNYTLVGLKNSEGDISLYLYDNDKYTLYENAKLTQMNVFPLDLEDTFKPNEKRTQITIDKVQFDAIKLSANGLYIVKARNLDTATDEYYEYDEKTNTLIRYIEEEEKEDKSKDEEIAKYKKMLVLLGFETILVILILICILIAKMKKNKRRKLRIEEEKRKQELLKLEKEKEEEEEKTPKRKRSTKKKEVLKNEKKKNN